MIIQCKCEYETKALILLSQNFQLGYIRLPGISHSDAECKPVLTQLSFPIFSAVLFLAALFFSVVVLGSDSGAG